MKKVLLTLFTTMLFCMASNAQEVGEVWIGGQIGYSTNKVGDGNRSKNFKFLPEGGYQLSNKWGLGISLGYMYSENPDEVESFLEAGLVDGAKVNYFRVAPFARYTICTFIEDRLVTLFIDGGIDYNHGTENDKDITLNAFGVGLRPGIKVNFSDRFSFVSKIGFLGYEYSKVSWANTKFDNNAFEFDFDMSQISFGLHYNF